MNPCFRGPGSAFATSLALGLFWLAPVVAAAPAPAELGLVSSQSSTQTVALEYRELEHGVLNSGLNFTPQTAPFKKEPAVGLRKVRRGNFFSGSPETAIPFLWDYTQGKLYLDLNRNRDLTDDPAGVCSCSLKHYSSSYQVFTNVHLSFKTAKGLYPALVDLTLYDYENQPAGFALCRSFWEGKISLQGRDYQVGFIENLSGNPGSSEGGHLLLRPWENRAQPFDLQDGTLDGFGFCRNLFFGKQAYRLDCAYLPQEPSPKYRITFQERTAEMGALNLTGKFIQRLVLSAQPGRAGYTVVLDSPDPSVKIPVGTYSQCQVQLQAGGVAAHHEDPRYGSPNLPPSVIVSAAKPAALAMGGPLTNSVSISRQGGSLRFSYQLIGPGGQNYQLLGTRNNPEFAVYQGDRKLASGKFEFG